MMTKWEFLAACCRRVNNEKAAKIADEISKSLDKLYELKHTSLWKVSYDYYYNYVLVNPSIEKILFIARNEHTCVACACHFICLLNFNRCYRCKFGEKHGICDNKGSLYTKFCEAVMLK